MAWSCSLFIVFWLSLYRKCMNNTTAIFSFSVYYCCYHQLINYAKQESKSLNPVSLLVMTSDHAWVISYEFINWTLSLWSVQSNLISHSMVYHIDYRLIMPWQLSLGQYEKFKHFAPLEHHYCQQIVVSEMFKKTWKFSSSSWEIWLFFNNMFFPFNAKGIVQFKGACSNNPQPHPPKFFKCIEISYQKFSHIRRLYIREVVCVNLWILGKISKKKKKKTLESKKILLSH